MVKWRVVGLRKEAKAQKTAILDDVPLNANPAFNALLRISFLDIEIPLENQLELILEYILSIPGLQIEPDGAIFIADPAKKELTMAASQGLSVEVVQQCNKVKFGQCICGRAISDVMYVDHIDEQHDNTWPKMEDHGHYCLPITYGSELQGVLRLRLKAGHKQNREEIRFLMATADIIASVIKQRGTQASYNQLVTKLRAAMGGVIDSIVLAIEARDPYTSGHQQRVSQLARVIATEMGLSPTMIDSIRLAGRIHDLGKIAIPAEILSKPTKLNNPEFELIKIHPETGHAILKDVDFPWPIADIVQQHHEKIDGSGYPQGLSGDDIRIESRILCVADVAEAISNHRPYRPALGVENAISELMDKKNLFFDPNVVDACVGILSQDQFAWDKIYDSLKQ